MQCFSCASVDPSERHAALVFAHGLPRNVELGVQRLSPIDHSAILTCINPKAFWFPAPGLLAPVLRASLANLLAHYPLLSGRLGSSEGPKDLSSLRSRLGCHISACNAGVEFVEAQDPAHRSMRDFPLGAMVRAGFAHMSATPTLPDFFTAVDIGKLLNGAEPLLKVRLTQLTCGGSILALTLAHAVLDGHSAAMFLNDWATLYRMELAATKSVRAVGPAARLQDVPAPPTPPTSPPAGNAVPVADAALASTVAGPIAAPAATTTAVAGEANRSLQTGPAAACAEGISQAGTPIQPLMDRSGLLLPGQLVKAKGMDGGNALQLTASTQPAAAPGAGLPCLSLQQVPEAGWLPAAKQIGSLVSMVRAQDKEWPGFRDDLCSMVLHLPPDQVTQLKVLASPAGTAISTNDAIASLVWCLMCDLRHRPLPGQAPQGSSNSMGLAIDLRKNGLKGEVPSTLFANATWCLHIPNATPMEPRGQGQGLAGRLMTAANTVPCSAGGDGSAGDQRDAKDLVVALKGGAAKVREALMQFRAANPASGKQVLELAAAQCTAPFSSQLHLACNVMTGQDAMLSSWQFPYWQADFGAGGPLRYMGALHPTPPWSAAVMAGHPSHGGLYLFLVVPSSARGAVRGSTVLSSLVPGARFA